MVRNLLKEPVSILMPVSNEEGVIEEVIEEWVEDVFQYLPEGSEFLFDEAGSTDGTRNILKKLCKKYTFLDVNYHDKKEGFSIAAKRLYKRSKCPLIFFTDSDGQYIAKDFWKLTKCIDRYDMIHGVKIGRKDPFLRRLLSFFFNKTINFVLSIYLIDMNSAFRLVKADVMKNVIPRCVSIPTFVNAESLLHTIASNYEVKQVYILHRERKFGVSRGLRHHRYLLDGLLAVKGLYKIKKSYREKE